MYKITNANIKDWAKNYDGPLFDGILCDPPYHLVSIAKRFGGENSRNTPAMNTKEGGVFARKTAGFMGKDWDGVDENGIGIAQDPEMWRLLYNLLKPGGHLLAFSGSRTYHRMAVAIEDAGFEIRDQLIWMYGCLSEDTEILTVNGWKRYHKAILSDTVVCYNIDNDNYELHKPTDKFYYDNKHTAYRIKSDTTDQIVSRNHRVIVERNGRKVFAQAETLERQESVPVLESLSALPDTIHNPQQGSSITKQDLLKKVWQQDDSRKEQWQEAGKDTVSSLQGNVLPNGQKQEQPTQGMFKKVQRLLTRSRLEETRTQGQSQLETRKRTGTGNKNDWRNQSKLERWFDLSEQKRQVRKSSDKIRQMSERILGYGSDRRLCYGTPIASSAADWQTTNTLGVSTPRQSRRNRQSYRKLNAIQDERGTQEIRVGSRHNTTLATVEPIEYTGKVWCVTVPTGAFVARRNGQIFITGNSGFPKSLNIGKAVDRLQGNERESVGKYEIGGMTPDRENFGANDRSGGKGMGFRPGEIEITKGTSEWEGYGTALKPSHEPCVLARKPLDGTVANNVLKHGTGGLAIDNTRIKPEYNLQGSDLSSIIRVCQLDHLLSPVNSVELKRFQDDTNSAIKTLCSVLETADTPISEKTHGITQEDIIKKVTSCLEEIFTENTNTSLSISGSGKKQTEKTNQKDMKSTISTVSKMITDWKISSSLVSQLIEALLTQARTLKTTRDAQGRFPSNLILDGSDEVEAVFPQTKSGGGNKANKQPTNITQVMPTIDTSDWQSNTGSASRYFYCAKASKSERNAGLEGFEPQITNDGREKDIDNAFQRGTTLRSNHHPTIKPLSLTKYLATLIKPPTGGRLLVPFSGSGSEMIGALQAGWEYVEGVELTEEYIPIAEARIKYWLDQMAQEDAKPKQVTLV